MKFKELQMGRKKKQPEEEAGFLQNDTWYENLADILAAILAVLFGIGALIWFVVWPILLFFGAVSGGFLVGILRSLL